jgi:hypothetical protein
MTTYTVNVYREMRLIFPAIEAATPEAAARLAAAMPTYSADAIDDCDGFTYSALVARDGCESQTVFFRADGGEIEPAPERITNRTRAAWAEACVSVFMQHTGCDAEDALGDLLCDLMHFGHQRNYALPAALDRALGHFAQELDGEGQVLPDPFCPAVGLLLEALEDLLPHASREVEDRKATGVAEYDDLEEAVEKARAAISATTKPPGSPPILLDALLDIKHLASKHDDNGYEPYTVLELIEATAIAALAKAKGGAQ